MGLLNLYNAMAMRPHIPYRFKAEIWPNNEGPYDEDNKNRKRIEFTIKRISQPVFNLNSDNKVYFGNTAYVVPIMKFGETTLEITFEETDDMAVFKLLAGFMGNELYKGIHGGLINIRVTQFDETMVSIVDKKTYVCRLKEHSMPSFNNNGFGSPVELTASFNVVYIMDEPREFEDIVDGKIVIKRDEADMLPDNEEVEKQLQNVILNEEVEKEQKDEERQKVLRGGRSKALQEEVDKKDKIRQEQSGKLVDATHDLFEKLAENNEVMKHISGNDYMFGVQNYAKQLAADQNNGNGTSFDYSLLTDEERANIIESFGKLDNSEKLRYMLGVDASDVGGLDNDEVNTIMSLVDQFGDDATREALDNAIEANDNFLVAQADYEEAANKRDLPQPQVFDGDPVRYREGAKPNKAAGVDNLSNLIDSGKLTDKQGREITTTADLKVNNKYFVDGHQYKAVYYDGKWSLNSDVAGNDFSYERAAANPEEVFQNVLADGPIMYNLGGKSDGNIKDGLDCMGFVGIIMQATGSDVVDADGNKLDYKNVKSVFSNYNTANFFDKDFKIVAPPGSDIKVFVAKEGKNSGHIYVEYNGYIYEAASGKGVIKTEKSKWNNKGLNYKNVMASEVQVAQFNKSSKNKNS